MNDDHKTSAEQRFPEAGDWSAMSEELAQQLNADAQHLVKRYSAPNVSDLAARITAKISSEQNSVSQPVALHVVNGEVSDTQAVGADSSSSQVFHDLNPNGNIVIDRAESLEWLKISAAAMLFLTATASAIWYSSRLTENATPSVVNQSIGSVPQNPIIASQGSPVIATTKINNQEPVNAVLPIRGTVRVEENPIQRNSHIGEVSFDAKAQPQAPKHTIDNEAEMLRSQLSAFEHVIQVMQKEISDLRKETSKLQKQIAEQKQSANGKIGRIRLGREPRNLEKNAEK